jgi:hypothetical protein
VRLTVKLRGRAEASARRRGRTISSGARGAERRTHHGPLQRLLCRTVAPACSNCVVQLSYSEIAHYWVGNFPKVLNHPRQEPE